MSAAVRDAARTAAANDAHAKQHALVAISSASVVQSRDFVFTDEGRGKPGLVGVSPGSNISLLCLKGRRRRRAARLQRPARRDGP